MNPFCSNERDYHMHLIEHIDRLPELLKSESGVGVFVWGHEVKLLDAGSGGGDGLAACWPSSQAAAATGRAGTARGEAAVGGGSIARTPAAETVGTP